MGSNSKLNPIKSGLKVFIANAICRWLSFDVFTWRQLAADSESLRVAAAGRKINQFAVWRFSFVLMMRWLVWLVCSYLSSNERARYPNETRRNRLEMCRHQQPIFFFCGRRIDHVPPGQIKEENARQQTIAGALVSEPSDEFPSNLEGHRMSRHFLHLVDLALVTYVLVTKSSVLIWSPHPFITFIRRPPAARS